MKKFLVQSILLIIIIFGALIFANPTGISPNFQLPFLPQAPKISDLEINGKTIKVEIADTREKRKKGLGGRQSLGENEGMLFIFERLDKHPFWMKGLSFALDFIWIKDEKVVDILEDIPPPKSGQKDAELPIYSSREPVNKVLELNAGTVQKLNIKLGDTIKLTP